MLWNGGSSNRVSEGSVPTTALTSLSGIFRRKGQPDRAASQAGQQSVDPDTPTLVLVHGFGGGVTDFADHLERLARTHRVIAFDLRGHGASTAPTSAQDYHLDRFADDVIAVLDACSVGRTRLLGHSLGGMVAREVVHRIPQRVEALVLMNTSAGPPPGLDRSLVAVAAEVAATEGMVALKALLDSVADDVSSVGGTGGNAALLERQAQNFSVLTGLMWSTVALEICDQPHRLEQLARYSGKTLIMVGELDTMFLPAAREMAGAVAHAELVVFEGVGHHPQFERPEEWILTLERFFAGI